MMHEIRHPETNCDTRQNSAFLFDCRPPPEAIQLGIQICVACRADFVFLRWIEPQYDSPAHEDRDRDTWHKGEKPLTVENLHLPRLFDYSAAQNRRRTGNQHLVENCCSVSDDDE